MADNNYEELQKAIQEKINALKTASWTGVDFDSSLFVEQKITAAIAPSLAEYINTYGPIIIQVDDEKKFLLNNKTNTDTKNEYNFSLAVVGNFVEREEFAEQFITNEVDRPIDNEMEANADFEMWSTTETPELEAQIPNPTINSEAGIAAWVEGGKNEGWFLEAGTITQGSYDNDYKNMDTPPETYNEDEDGSFYAQLSKSGKISYIFPYYSVDRTYSLTGKYRGTGKVKLYCYNYDDTLSNKYIKSNLLLESTLSASDEWKTFSGFNFSISETNLTNITFTSVDPDYYCILTFENTSAESVLDLDTLFLAYSDAEDAQVASMDNTPQPAAAGEKTLAELKAELETLENNRIDENQEEWYKLIHNLLQWIKEFGKITVQTVNSGSYDVAEDSDYGIDFTTYTAEVTYLPETSTQKEIDITYTNVDFLTATRPEKIKIDQTCNFILQSNSIYHKLINFVIKTVTDQIVDEALGTTEEVETDVTNVFYLGDNKFSIPPVGENVKEIKISFDIESVIYDVNTIQIADKSIEDTVIAGDSFTTEEYEEDIEEDLVVDNDIPTDDTEENLEDVELEDFDASADEDVCPDCGWPFSSCICNDDEEITITPGVDDLD